jgi:hypothetical protein
VEREVIFSAYSKYLQSPSAWFQPRADGRATLQTTRTYMHGHLIPRIRIRDVKMLGALCALLLINGICPDPFNPLLFLLIVYNFNMHSLDCETVGEWHPKLRQTIDSWLAAGATGDATPFRDIFCSYLGMDVSIRPNIYFILSLTCSENIRLVFLLVVTMFHTKPMLLKCYMQPLLGLSPHLTPKYEAWLKVLVFPAEMGLNSTK